MLEANLNILGKKWFHPKKWRFTYQSCGSINWFSRFTIDLWIGRPACPMKKFQDCGYLMIFSTSVFVGLYQSFKPCGHFLNTPSWNDLSHKWPNDQCPNQRLSEIPMVSCWKSLPKTLQLHSATRQLRNANSWRVARRGHIATPKKIVGKVGF